MQNNPSSSSRFRFPAPRKSAVMEKPGAIAVNGLILSLSVLKETADVIPFPAGSIIKGSVGGFLQVVDIIQVIYATPISEEFSNTASFRPPSKTSMTLIN